VLLVGHSFGGGAVLKAAERLSRGDPAGGMSFTGKAHI
jgi:hypothetical protein